MTRSFRTYLDDLRPPFEQNRFFRFFLGRLENIYNFINYLTNKYDIFQRPLLRYRAIIHIVTLNYRSKNYSYKKIYQSQWRQLQRLITFAFKHVPFYQDVSANSQIHPEDIRNPSDLSLLPILTKELVRRNFPDQMLVPGKKYNSSLLAQTSGSTAESIHHMRPQQAWRRTLINSVLLQKPGLITCPIFVLSTPHCTGSHCEIQDPNQPFSIPFFSKILPLRHLGEMIPIGTAGNILEASSDFFKKTVDTLNGFSSSILVGDPVYLTFFAWNIKNQGLKIPKVQFIITSYELMTKSQRDLIHSVFGCDIHTQYGGSEVLGVANTCEHHFLHEMPDNVWIEIIKEGRPALPGEIGRILLTDLNNVNMPLIRYDIGDAFEPLEGPCPCGRVTKRVGIIHGRVADLFKTGGPTPRIVSPLHVDEIFRGIEGVMFYRLVQKQLDKYDIAILPQKTGHSPDLNLVKNRALKLLGHQSQINIRIVRTLAPERSMKFRFSYSELAPIEL
jgi:phenylacetate-CoA ligase